MPEVLEQIDKMSILDKMRLMEYLVKSVSVTIVQTGRIPHNKASRRIGSMAGKWQLPSDKEDKAMDEEIQAMFDCL